MSVLTFAVRFSHTAGLDRPGSLGQPPGKFLGSCTLAFFFFSFFLRLCFHACSLPLASSLSFSSSFLLSFSFFLSFVVARVLGLFPLPLHARGSRLELGLLLFLLLLELNVLLLTQHPRTHTVQKPARTPPKVE